MSGQSDRTVACAAIQRYDVAPLRVRLAARSFNSIFRVTSASAVYALRVGSTLAIHPEGTAAVEAAWHRRLRRQGMYVPDVQANVSGELTTLVPDHDTARVCVLFDWVAGRSLRTCLTERRSAALGALSARLHADAVTWSCGWSPQATCSRRTASCTGSCRTGSRRPGCDSVTAPCSPTPWPALSR